jgi:hypothetical protein
VIGWYGESTREDLAVTYGGAGNNSTRYGTRYKYCMIDRLQRPTLGLAYSQYLYPIPLHVQLVSTVLIIPVQVSYVLVLTQLYLYLYGTWEYVS